MDNAKEFEGKTLDDAISQACSFFDTAREKLEIDIIQDSKSGIFGLVGSRKAVIEAKLAPVSVRLSDILSAPSGRKSAQEAGHRANSAHSAGPKTSTDISIETSTDDSHADSHADSHVDSAGTPAGAFKDTAERRRKPQRRTEQPENSSPRSRAHAGAEGPAVEREARPRRAQQQRPARPNQPSAQRPGNDFDMADDLQNERTPGVPLEALDQELLKATVLETTRRLIEPIAGSASFELEIADGRVAVHIGSEEDLGLLIGREGQTLACLQYLASRIVARRMENPVRIQFDAGDYRERQDEKLRELALALADRARATGRSTTTRPLSSYQRRIVHMALQEDSNIQTRSTGEGPLKRVVIQRARGEQ